MRHRAGMSSSVFGEGADTVGVAGEDVGEMLAVGFVESVG